MVGLEIRAMSSDEQVINIDAIAKCVGDDLRLQVILRILGPTPTSKLAERHKLIRNIFHYAHAIGDAGLVDQCMKELDTLKG